MAVHVQETTFSHKMAMYLLEKGCVYSNHLASTSIIFTVLFFVFYSALLVLGAVTGFSFLPDENISFIVNGVFMGIPAFLAAFALALICNGVLGNILKNELNEVRKLHPKKVFIGDR